MPPNSASSCGRKPSRRGYAKARTTAHLGDGAAWIWENARLNFPEAVQILDFYHASEHTGERLCGVAQWPPPFWEPARPPRRSKAAGAMR